MLEHERAGDCAARLADRGCEADFFCLDLLEDRFPLLDCGPAGLVTKSDALDESLAASRLPLLGRVLERGREETETRWREGCLSAIARIRERFAPGRIILVKTFLADAYGEYCPERAFADAARIRESNAHLERCYAFFAEHCPGIRVVTVPERLRFSDASFKHGCAPWHLNDFCYYALAGEVRDHIMRVKQEASCAAKASSRGSAQ